MYYLCFMYEAYYLFNKFHLPRDTLIISLYYCLSLLDFSSSVHKKKQQHNLLNICLSITSSRDTKCISC